MRAELEATLRAAPDRDTLAVYADMLMGEGDPLGEQIALELQRPERWSLLTRWLASQLKVVPGGDHLFVATGASLAWLDEPIGEFVRGVSALARVEDAQRILAKLAQRRRPWLTRITLTAGFGPAVFTRELADAVPNLVELDVTGGCNLRAFAHPRVKRVRRSIESTEGGESLALELDLPAVEHVALQLQPWPKDFDPAKVTLERLPALRTLDVSACEPVFSPPRTPRYSLDVFRWLSELALVPRLATLRVPSVRTPASAKLLRAIADRAPGVAIEVARVYSRCNHGGELAPRVAFPPPWPWLPDNETHSRWIYRVELPGKHIDMLTSAIGGLLARIFDQRDEAFRDDWRTIWAALDRCDAKPVQLPFGLLHRAFAAWPYEPDNGSSWCALRAEVVAAAPAVPPDRLVTIALRR